MRPLIRAAAILLALFAARPATAEIINPVVEFTVWNNPALKFQATLFADKTPITVANFLNYVNDSRYTNTIIHRTTTQATEGIRVVQGGGYAIVGGDGTLNGSVLDFVPTFAAIQNEALLSNLSNVRGTIAMARTDDPNSATSQWFINIVDNPGLNPGANPLQPAGYAVFGEVTMGMSLIDEMSYDVQKGSGSLAVGAPPVSVPFSGVPLLPNGDIEPYGNPYFVVVTNVAVVPEPSSLALAAAGAVIAVAAARWKRCPRPFASLEACATERG